MDPRLTDPHNPDDRGDRLIRIGKLDERVAMYWHETRGGGYSVYLYEKPNWQLNGPWLLKGYRSTRGSADELFNMVEGIL